MKVLDRSKVESRKTAALMPIGNAKHHVIKVAIKNSGRELRNFSHIFPMTGWLSLKDFNCPVNRSLTQYIYWICRGSSKWKAARMRSMSSAFMRGLEGSTRAGSPGAKWTIACEMIEINISRMIRCHKLRKIKLITIGSAVNKKLYFLTWTFYNSVTISTTFWK